MAEYPSNSNKAKESSLVREQQTSVPQPKTADIPQSTHPRAPQQRKISPVREIFKAIFPGGFNQIKEQLIWDIFVPWAQDMLHNGWQGLGDVIFPGSGGNRSKPSGNPEHYSYDEAYRPKTYSSYYEYDMKPFRTQKEADETLNELHEIMMKYGIVTLLDFNDKVGNRTNPTQANYGWTNINAADIRRVRDGWIIEMPKARPIDG